MSKLGGPAVCLAIPGKILEISSGNQRAAPVDVAGVRRRSIWHWSKTMHPALMVSSEGSCAAYYNHEHRKTAATVGAGG